MGGDAVEVRETSSLSNVAATMAWSEPLEDGDVLRSAMLRASDVRRAEVVEGQAREVLRGGGLGPAGGSLQSRHVPNTSKVWALQASSDTGGWPSCLSGRCSTNWACLCPAAIIRLQDGGRGAAWVRCGKVNNRASSHPRPTNRTCHAQFACTRIPPEDYTYTLEHPSSSIAPSRSTCLRAMLRFIVPSRSTSHDSFHCPSPEPTQSLPLLRTYMETLVK